MVDFSDAHKAQNNNKYFPEGVHKVQIMLVSFDETDSGKEFVEFTLVDDDGHEDTARLWFTTDKAINYSFDIIRGIFVHNAPDAKKDATRERFDKINNTEELDASCQKMLIGKEAWLSVTKDAERTYERGGKVYASINKNITGYEPGAKDKTPSDKGAGTLDSITTKDENGNDQVVADF